MIFKKPAIGYFFALCLASQAFGSVEQLIDYRALAGNTDAIDLHELPLGTVYDRHDRTVTKVGKIVLRSKQPSIDPFVVEAQAGSVAALSASADVRVRIRRLLEECDSGIDELAAYTEGATEYHQIADGFYLPEWRYFFPKFFNRLNESERVLNSAAAISVARHAIVMANAMAISGIFAEGAAAFSTGKFNLWSAIKNGPGSIVMRHMPYRTVDDAELFTKATFWRSAGLSFADRVAVLSALSYRFEENSWIPTLHTNSDSRSALKKAGATGVVTAYTAWTDYAQFVQVRNSVRAINEVWKNIGMVRKAIAQIARLISASQEIEALLVRVGADSHAQAMEKALVHLKTDAKELFDQLSTETFVGDSDVYSRGRVLVAHRRLVRQWQNFAPLCTALGEIDALTSWAECIHAEPLHWSVPHITQSTLELQGVWHPVLSESHAVLNDFVGENLTVITGPNGCGKTTVLESVALAGVLHQTWGIVPAREAFMPVFSCISTSLRALGTVAEGKSRFMAQMEQLRNLAARIVSYSGNQLIIVDEPLSGTIETTAGPRVAQWCRECMKHSGVMITVATHCAEPTRIEGVFLAHPEIVEVTPGQFVRTFKLFSGPADWWFNDMARRERFISWLERSGIHNEDAAFPHHDNQ